MTVIVKIQSEAIDIAACMLEADALTDDFGAQLSFTGYVRRDD